MAFLHANVGKANHLDAQEVHFLSLTLFILRRFMFPSVSWTGEGTTTDTPEVVKEKLPRRLIAYKNYLY